MKKVMKHSAKVSLWCAAVLGAPSLVLALAVVAAPGPAFAEGQTSEQPTLENPLTARIKKADCVELVKHEPDDDVAYRPGVDVHGDAVAPADLYGGYAIDVPRTVIIPIEVDLFDRFGRPADRRYEGEVAVGLVEIDLEDGYATFNGQPISAPAQAELAARCREHLAR